MKKKTLLLVIACSLFFIYSNAQYKEIIDSNRPGQSVSVFTTGKNIAQFETGVSFSDSDQSYTSNVFLRYGVTDRIEVNGGGSYLLSETDRMTTGLTNYNLGFKFNVFEGDTMMPSTAVQVGFSIPSENLSEQRAFASLLFLINNIINDKLSYTINFGVNLDLEKSQISVLDDDGNPKLKDITYFEGIYTFNLMYKISNKFSVFLEPYGSFNRYDPPKIKINANAGLSYLVGNNFQLDLYGGHGVNNNEYFTVNAGLSWRLDLR